MAENETAPTPILQLIFAELLSKGLRTETPNGLKCRSFRATTASQFNWPVCDNDGLLCQYKTFSNPLMDIVYLFRVGRLIVHSVQNSSFYHQPVNDNLPALDGQLPL